MAYGVGSAAPPANSIGAQAVREATQLERHLTALRSIQDDLNKVFTRALNVSDRLLGQEPPSINKTGENTLKEPAEPPLLRRLELTGMALGEIVQSIHYQLNRLESL